MTKNAIGLLDLSAGELPLTPSMPAWCIVAQPESYAWRIQHCRPPPYPCVHQVCRGWPLATWHVLLQHGMDLPVLDLSGQSRERVCAARATRLRRSARLHWAALVAQSPVLHTARAGPGTCVEANADAPQRRHITVQVVYACPSLLCGPDANAPRPRDVCP